MLLFKEFPEHPLYICERSLLLVLLLLLLSPTSLSCELEQLVLASLEMVVSSVTVSPLPFMVNALLFVIVVLISWSDRFC